MTNTKTAAHLTTSAAEGIIRTVADRPGTNLETARQVSATIDGRVGAAIDKLGQEAAAKLFVSTQQSLAKRAARWAKAGR